MFGWQCFIYENGTQIAEAERFSLDPQLIIGEIDIEKLRSERRSNTTFANAQKDMYVDPIGGVLPEKTYVNCLPKENTEREFTLTRKINPQPFIQSEDMEAACEEVFNIQVTGLARRLLHTNCKTIVIGVSGGLDSTLALLVCVACFR